MNLTRRDLAAAGVLALGATALIGSARAQSPDEAAVKKTIQDLRTAYLNKDKAALESLTAPQLTYSHSAGNVEDKTQFINGVMARKSTVKSLEYPDLTVQVSGDTAIVRHLWVSETELEGKVTNTKVGVTQVLQKQGGGWKLLARTSFRFPPPAAPA